MPYDYIDPQIGVPIAIFLWGLLFVLAFKKPVVDRVNDYFAWRRHVRRQRNKNKSVAKQHGRRAYNPPIYKKG